ncbi:MAG: hypothetical protein Q7O66_06615, partial [Dehalococcoidia bacterium]|nr:hypothetical protein [Dehalococcoidia bacterium]
ANDSLILEIGYSSKQSVWSYYWSGFCQEVGICQGPPADAIRLANGDTLIAIADSGQSLLEVNPARQTVSLRQGYIAYAVEQLANGDWLVPHSGLTTAKVAELLPATGVELWSYSPPGFSDVALMYPHYADHTRNDTFLIADTGKDRILEVNRNKQVIWSYAQNLKTPWSVLELP